MMTTTNVNTHVLFLGRAELVENIKLEGIQVTVIPPSQFDPASVSRPPDLIFLEKGQPYTLSLESATVPVIMIVETDVEGRAAVEAGAADYILYSKLDAYTLEKCVKSTLREHRLRRESKEYAAALQISEERFRRMVEISPDGILIIDREGLIAFANPAAQAMFERDLADLLHRPFGYPTVPNGASEIKLLRQDGEQCFAEMRAAELLWENKRAFLAMLRDITERKQIENAEREQRIFAEALRDSILSLTSTLELSKVLDLILENLGRVVPHDAANIMLIQAGSDEAHVVRARGYKLDDEQELYRLSLPIEEIKTLSLMRDNHQPLIVPDVHQYEGWVQVLPWDIIESYAGAPLIMRDQVMGYVNLNSFHRNFFNESHLEGLRAFAAHAANAIQNAQLYEQAQKAAALEERQRLARDLHDAVSQSLFSSSVIAQTLPLLKEKNPELMWQNLDKLQRLNRGALAEMRSLLLELRPDMFEATPLFDLIKQYTDSIIGRTLLQININVLGSSDLPGEVKLAFYRIMQEALNNIIKHAHATNVYIDLLMEDHVSRLSLRDDGKGFDVSKRPPSRMGLKNMEERAAGIGATITIQSEPGSGTEIILEWRESSPPPSFQQIT